MVLGIDSWLPVEMTGVGRRGLLSERVAHLIERFIVDRHLKPGDRLPSGREFTDRFGVSRTVVRDAIAVLEQRGLVEARPGSGVYVRDGGSDAVADVLGQMLRQSAISLPELMETRQLLEVHTVIAATQRASATDLDSLVQAIDDMVRASGAHGFVEADVAFHEAIARTAGNRVLMAFLRSLRPLLLHGMLIGTRLDGAQAAAIREHTAILEAIRRGDASAARNLMKQHLDRSYEELAQAGHVEHPRQPARSDS